MLSPNTFDSAILLLYLVKRCRSVFPEADITTTLNMTIWDGVRLGHDFEVMWALWGAESLGIVLDQEILRTATRTGPSCNRLLAAFLARRYYRSFVFTAEAATSDPLDNNLVSSADWLVLYESCRMNLFNGQHERERVWSALQGSHFGALEVKQISFFDTEMFGDGAAAELGIRNPRFGKCLQPPTHETDFDVEYGASDSDISEEIEDPY